MARRAEIEIPVAGETLFGSLEVAREDHGIVVFAHGSGSSRHSPRNQHVAHGLTRTLCDLRR